MLTPIKHYPVNWVDGMKISKAHFQALERSVYSQVRDSIALSLTDYNYGLLPPIPGAKKSLDIQYLVDQSDKIIKVKVLECRAITSNGSRIEITNSSKATLAIPDEELETEYNLGESGELLFDIVIGVDPFSRVPVGNPDPAEDPPRHPSTIADYQVKIVPSDQMNLFEFGANHISVGKLRVVSGEVELSERYIPPCSRVDSHPSVITFYNDLIQFNQGLLTNAIKIIQKIQTKSDRNVIADNMYYLTDRIISFLSENMDEIRLRYASLPPIFMLNYMVRLGRLVRSVIDIRAGIGKEELLNYFNEWSDLNPGEFETILNTLVTVEYDHTDIMKSFEKAYRFQNVLGSLFNTLNELDYIGKQKVASAPAPPPPPAPEPQPEQPKRSGKWTHLG